MNKNEYLSERNPKELIWFMITHPLRLMLSRTKYSMLCVRIDKVVGKFSIPLNFSYNVCIYLPFVFGLLLFFCLVLFYFNLFCVIPLST